MYFVVFSGFPVQRKSLVVPRTPGQMDISVGSDTEMSQDSPFNESLNVDVCFRMLYFLIFPNKHCYFL